MVDPPSSDGSGYGYDGKTEGAIGSGRVKQIEFAPSGKKLWVVVGSDSEYWVDPELDFCSCKDFYFNALSSQGGSAGGSQCCYHLKSVKKAQAENGFVKVQFHDSEYVQFLHALAKDAEDYLLRR